MNKVKVVICTGTTCYVMGGAGLMGLREDISEDIADHVEITGSTCLELCKNEQYRSAPFAKVNDIVISQATAAKITEEIVRQLKP